jgi:hypothetical protein
MLEPWGLVEAPLVVEEPVLPLPIVFEVGAPPACGEPAAAWVWWCSGPGVAVAVPVCAVSFISAVSVGMIVLLSPTRFDCKNGSMRYKGIRGSWGWMRKNCCA